MARPIEEGAAYFPHDHDMRNDPRVRALRKRYPHGLGYSVYCMTLEALTDARGFCLSTTPGNVELVAADFELDPAELLAIWDCCVSLVLLQRDDERSILWSARHQERLSVVVEYRRRDRDRKRRSRCPADSTGRPVENPNIPPDNRGYPPGQSNCHADVRSFPRNESRVEESSSSSPLNSSSIASHDEPGGGAGGATDGASAPATPAAGQAPGEPEPMRPEHLATLEARAAGGDRFALEALRRARHDGRLPHLPHPAAGSTPDPPPDDDWPDDPKEAP